MKSMPYPLVPLALAVSLLHVGVCAEPRHHTRIRLVADVQSVAPGSQFTVGLLMSMDPGWHTYWKNPGEAGLPTSITWTLPAGVTAGEIQWPVPEKYSEGGEVLSYGYAGENMLLVPMTVSQELRHGTQLLMKGDVKWLECEKICIPGSQSVELTLPVTASRGQNANDLLFAKYRGRLPTPLAVGSGISLKSEARGSDVWLSLVPAAPLNLVLEKDAVPDFYPEPLADVVIGRTQQVSLSPEAARLRVPLSVFDKTDRKDTLRGILIFQRDGGRRAAASVEVPLSREFLAGLSGAGEPSAPVSVLDQQFTSVHAASSSEPLFLYILYAIIGGILLNIMPCVLPVISLKVFGLVKMSGDQPRKVKRLGLVFSSGIVASFLVLALLVIILKATGEQVGWGFQFQEPLFVIAMSAVVFAFGLSLFGVYEITVPGGATTGLSDVIARQRREGYAASFWEGVFATILATPCTAPVLGTALGFAFSQPWWIILLIFTATALGMALPYLLLTTRPVWMKYLPKPGAWMETAKQFMGFLMMATLLWLLYILGKQLGMEGVIWTSAFLLVVAIACWIIGRFVTLAADRRQRTIAWATALVLVVAGYWFFLESTLNVRQLIAGISPTALENQARDTDKIQWQPFSVALLDSQLRSSRLVFVDFTAEWCLTCKVNEKTVIASKDVVEQFKKHDIVAVRADWTNRNPDITRLLQKFGRSGVPLYVIFPAGRPNEPIVLPEVVTPSIIIDAIQKAVAL